MNIVCLYYDLAFKLKTDAGFPLVMKVCRWESWNLVHLWRIQGNCQPECHLEENHTECCSDVEGAVSTVPLPSPCRCQPGCLFCFCFINLVTDPRMALPSGAIMEPIIYRKKENLHGGGPVRMG
jgi:hypothetical protein